MDELAEVCSGVPGETTDRSEEEFERHLASIGWDSSFRRGQTSRTVEAPKQVSPAIQEPSRLRTDVPNPSSGTGKGLVFRLVLAILLVVCVVFRDPLNDAVRSGWAHFSGQSQLELRANILLTQAHFLSLQPGTPAEEVRDRVGIPSSRAKAIFPGGQEDWYYTTKPDATSDGWHFYVVTMSDGKVLRTVDLTQLRAQTSALLPQLAVPQYFGDLKALCKGRRKMLPSSAKAALVLLGPSTDPEVLPDLALPVLQPERLNVAKTGAQLQIPPIALYWRGVLYPLPTSSPAISPSLLADDLIWLFKVLGCDETGKTRIPSQPVRAEFT